MGLGTLNNLFGYGQQLLGAQKNEKAMEVFLLNADKMKTMKAVGDMDKFLVYAGLALGYRANKKIDEALTNAKKAQEIAPNDQLKGQISNLVTVLEQSK